MNKWILHVEGLTILVLSLYLYYYFSFSWLLLIICLFLPDISIFAYRINNHFGAITYNLFHTYTLPIIVIFIGFISDVHIFLAIGLIFAIHIGMDRTIGFGLKYKSSFHDNHLQRI